MTIENFEYIGKYTVKIQDILLIPNSDSISNIWFKTDLIDHNYVFNRQFLPYLNGSTNVKKSLDVHFFEKLNKYLKNEENRKKLKNNRELCGLITAYLHYYSYCYPVKKYEEVYNFFHEAVFAYRENLAASIKNSASENDSSNSSNSSKYSTNNNNFYNQNSSLRKTEIKENEDNVIEELLKLDSNADSDTWKIALEKLSIVRTDNKVLKQKIVETYIKQAKHTNLSVKLVAIRGFQNIALDTMTEDNYNKIIEILINAITDPNQSSHYDKICSAALESLLDIKLTSDVLEKNNFIGVLIDVIKKNNQHEQTMALKLLSFIDIPESKKPVIFETLIHVLKNTVFDKRDSHLYNQDKERRTICKHIMRKISLPDGFIQQKTEQCLEEMGDHIKKPVKTETDISNFNYTMFVLGNLNIPDSLVETHKKILNFYSENVMHIALYAAFKLLKNYYKTFKVDSEIRSEIHAFKGKLLKRLDLFNSIYNIKTINLIFEVTEYCRDVNLRQQIIEKLILMVEDNYYLSVNCFINLAKNKMSKEELMLTIIKIEHRVKFCSSGPEADKKLIKLSVILRERLEKKSHKSFRLNLGKTKDANSSTISALPDEILIQIEGFANIDDGLEFPEVIEIESENEKTHSLDDDFDIEDVVAHFGQSDSSLIKLFSIRMKIINLKEKLLKEREELLKEKENRVASIFSRSPLELQNEIDLIEVKINALDKLLSKKIDNNSSYNVETQIEILLEEIKSDSLIKTDFFSGEFENLLETIRKLYCPGLSSHNTNSILFGDIDENDEQLKVKNV